MKIIAHKQNERGVYLKGLMEGWGSCFKKKENMKFLSPMHTPQFVHHNKSCLLRKSSFYYTF